MKNFISVLFFTMAVAICSISCNDKEDDPQPLKTDLELIQEGILGYWDLQSIEVTKGSETVVYSGGCDESGFSTWVQANVGDVDYNFTSSEHVDQNINCPNKQINEITYFITEENGKFYVNIDDGYKFELITGAKEISGEKQTIYIKVKQINTPIQGATSVIRNYKKSS